MSAMRDSRSSGYHARLASLAVSIARSIVQSNEAGSSVWCRWTKCSRSRERITTTTRYFRCASIRGVLYPSPGHRQGLGAHVARRDPTPFRTPLTSIALLP
eukprot:1192433-Prorocentrum_minimum.AAC.2